CLVMILFSFTNCRVLGQIHHDPQAKIIQIKTKDKHLSLAIDYAKGAKVSRMEIDDVNVLSNAGAVSTVKTDEQSWTSWHDDLQSIKDTALAGTVILEDIKMGEVMESWKFSLAGDKVLWTITRAYLKDMVMDAMAIPVWHFDNLQTWKGGILDNGGMVWCKYLSDPNDTYGVHTGGVTFWNEDQE